jgi:hypothetical protein
MIDDPGLALFTALRSQHDLSEATKLKGHTVIMEMFGLDVLRVIYHWPCIFVVHGLQGRQEVIVVAHYSQIAARFIYVTQSDETRPRIGFDIEGQKNG